MKASGHVMNIGAFSALQVMFHAPPLATSPATRSNNTGINNAPRLRPECRTEACPSRHLQRLISLRTLHRQFFLTLAGSISVWIKRFLIEEIIWHQPKKPRMRAKTKRFLADADQLPGAQAARMVRYPTPGISGRCRAGFRVRPRIGAGPAAEEMPCRGAAPAYADARIGQRLGFGRRWSSNISHISRHIWRKHPAPKERCLPQLAFNNRHAPPGEPIIAAEKQYPAAPPSEAEAISHGPATLGYIHADFGSAAEAVTGRYRVSATGNARRSAMDRRSAQASRLAPELRSR